MAKAEHRDGRRFSRRTASTLAVAATLACIGWGSPASSQQKVELGVLAIVGFSPESPNPAFASAFKEAWDKFAADNPGVTLKLFKIGGVDSLQEVVALAAAGRLPDVGIPYSGWVPRLHQGNYLQPLEGVLSAADEADFLPGVLESGTLDGKLRAIFFYNSWRGLFYRPSAVKAIGYDAPPTDWEEFLKFGEAARKKGHQSAVMFPAIKSELTMLYMLPQFFGLGGELYDAQGKPDFFNAPNRAKLEQVMQLWRDLVASGLMPAAVGAMDEAAQRPFFYSGQTLTVGSSTSFTKQMLLDRPDLVGDLNVSNLPMPAGAKPVPLLSNWGYSVFTKDPARAAVAQKFVRHMTSASVMGKLNDLMGQLPVRKSIWETVPAFSEGEMMKRLFAIQNDPRLRSASSKFGSYQVVVDAISEQMADVVSGKTTPADAVTKAGSRALAAYERTKAN